MVDVCSFEQIDDAFNRNIEKKRFTSLFGENCKFNVIEFYFIQRYFFRWAGTWEICSNFLRYTFQGFFALMFACPLPLGSSPSGTERRRARSPFAATAASSRVQSRLRTRSARSRGAARSIVPLRALFSRVQSLTRVAPYKMSRDFLACSLTFYSDLAPWTSRRPLTALTSWRFLESYGIK